MRGHINTDVPFLFLSGRGEKMLADTPLFWFESEVLFALGRFWLVEWSVFWNGDRQIMEMVEVDPKDVHYGS